MPPTPPPDIDLELWEDSIDRVLDWEPASLGLTHFGEIDQPQAHLELVRERLREQAELARELPAEEFEQPNSRVRWASEPTRRPREAMLQAVPPEQQWRASTATGGSAPTRQFLSEACARDRFASTAANCGCSRPPIGRY